MDAPVFERRGSRPDLDMDVRDQHNHAPRVVKVHQSPSLRAQQERNAAISRAVDHMSVTKGNVPGGPRYALPGEDDGLREGSPRQFSRESRSPVPAEGGDGGTGLTGIVERLVGIAEEQGRRQDKMETLLTDLHREVVDAREAREKSGSKRGKAKPKAAPESVVKPGDYKE